MSAVDTLYGPTDVDSDSKPQAVPQLSPEKQKAIWRKVDYRLMPILSLVYLSAFLDRGDFIPFLQFIDLLRTLFPGNIGANSC
jgi:hypothetical protein